MSDSVIGTAVLDRCTGILYLDTPNHGQAHGFSALPVHEKGTAKPDRVSWEYEIKGHQIHVTPSVRIATTRPSKANREVNEEVELFHNEGSWSVPFKDFVSSPEHAEPYDLFISLNPRE